MSGGFLSAEAQLAQAVMRERVRRLWAGQSGRAVLDAEAACRHAPWYRRLPGTAAEEIDAFAMVARYDARTLLSLVPCPVLAVFVERERPQPVWRTPNSRDGCSTPVPPATTGSSWSRRPSPAG